MTELPAPAPTPHPLDPQIDPRHGWTHWGSPTDPRRRPKPILVRYAMTDLMAGPERRVWRVAELVEALLASGFDLGPQPSKWVSDLLRAEVRRGRVARGGWGRYRAGDIPGGTRRRIRKRARMARQAAAEGADADALRGLRSAG